MSLEDHNPDADDDIPLRIDYGNVNIPDHAAYLEVYTADTGEKIDAAVEACVSQGWVRCWRNDNSGIDRIERAIEIRFREDTPDWIKKRIADGVAGADCGKNMVNHSLPAGYAARLEDAAVKRMVDRFLSWRLPDTFSPDNGITFEAPDNPAHWPVGTNLFDATQAEAMVRHLLQG